MKALFISTLLLVCLFEVVKCKDNIISEDVSGKLNLSRRNLESTNQNATCNCENGHCVTDTYGKQQCICPPEYGRFTERHCRACDCGKNANCTFERSMWYDDKYCLCPSGEKPRKNMRCKDPCSDNPCKNGGTCAEAVNGYSCKCKMPYSGYNCENDTCSDNPCKNGGTCIIAGNGYRCNCKISYSGNNCENDQCSDNPCKNGGTCTVAVNGYTCKCKMPYSGYNCENDPCSDNPCKNGGACTVTGNGYTCKCKIPYTGNNCENDPCSDNPCENGGTCSVAGNGYKCNCKMPYSGNNCENECKCENGHCKRDQIGQVICECLPEYGLYSEKSCKACDCGKNANCTFDNGTFWDEKYCLCPNGEKLKNKRCKENELPYSTENSDTPDWRDSTYITEPEHRYSTDHSDATDWIESTLSTGTEPRYSTESTESTDWAESTYSTGTEPRYSIENTESIEWTEATSSSATETEYSTDSSSTSDMTESSYSTAGVCDCGKHSISCYLDSEGNKMCVCKAGYSQLFGTCIDCYCGEKSIGCFFDKNKEKKCFCKEGYAQDREACKETCKYDRECLNGGICKLNYGGVGFCECRADYSGDRCEINNVCNYFDGICQRYGAICVIRDGLPSCECPPDKKDVTGLCEDICTKDKCMHGRCEIYGEDFKCRCEAGYDGKYCDTKIVPIKRDDKLFTLLMLIVFILILSIGVLCVALYFRLKKKAAASDLEKLVKSATTEAISVQRI